MTLKKGKYPLPAMFWLSCLLLMPALRVRADVFKILDDETEALQCRIDMIRAAREEILVSYYIIREDKIGKCLLGLLADAASRGVKVRVIMDSNGSHISRKTLAFLQKNGVEVRKFRIGPWFYLRRYTHRLHDKIMVSDGKWVIVGGRNIKGEYYGLGKKFNFEDRDVLVSGETVCREARFHFYKIWNASALSRKAYPGGISPEIQRQTFDSLLAAQGEIARLLKVRFDHPIGLWTENLRPTETPVRLLHDFFYHKKGRTIIETEHKNLDCTDSLISLLDLAKHSILIENPYFNPTPVWREAFRRAIGRGVKIRVLTNSIQSTDLLIRQASYLNKRKKLLRMGIEIHEFRDAKKLHAKALVIDDNVSLVGSYNIHKLSEQNNTEVAVWVADRRTAAEHRQIMERNLKKSVKIGKGNRPENFAGSGLPEATFGWRAVAWLFRWTVSLLV